jgi:hypothetical protein
MKKSFYIMAVTMAMVMVAAVAMAETVDIGLGSMDRAEFESLKQMIGGDLQPTARVSAEQTGQLRFAEFNQADVDEIREAMSTATRRQPASAFASDDNLVDIGTGSMATGDFCDLNKLVASNGTTRTAGFRFICP